MVKLLNTAGRGDVAPEVNAAACMFRKNIIVAITHTNVKYQKEVIK